MKPKQKSGKVVQEHAFLDTIYYMDNEFVKHTYICLGAYLQHFGACR